MSTYEHVQMAETLNSMYAHTYVSQFILNSVLFVFDMLFVIPFSGLSASHNQ